jgi:hypothetical protein
VIRVPLIVAGCIVAVIVGLPGSTALVGSPWPLAGVGIAAIILTVLIAAAVKWWGRAFVSALLSTAAFSPAIAAGGTLIAYLAVAADDGFAYRGLTAVTWGVELAVSVCVVVAAADHARRRGDVSMRALGEIDARLAALAAELQSAKADAKQPGDRGSPLGRKLRRASTPLSLRCMRRGTIHSRRRERWWESGAVSIG